MKKKALSILAALLLVFVSSTTVFAAVPEPDAEINQTVSISFVLNRASATRGEVDINIQFSQEVDRYSVVLYLQKLSDGKWVSDTTNPDYATHKNGIRKESLFFSKIYTNLKRGTSYRIKCVSRDYIGDNTHIATAYSRAF